MTADLRTVADMRLREAQALLGLGEHSGAYYLAGYAVECGLKAVITRTLIPHALPDRTGLKTLGEAFTHDFVRLVELANLDGELHQELRQNPQFQAYWGVAKDWTETSRYELWTVREASQMVEAVGHADDGVLRWIRPHW
jgi:HEPN domain-containing protein